VRCAFTCVRLSNKYSGTNFRIATSDGVRIYWDELFKSKSIVDAPAAKEAASSSHWSSGIFKNVEALRNILHQYDLQPLNVPMLEHQRQKAQARTRLTKEKHMDQWDELGVSIHIGGEAKSKKRKRGTKSTNDAKKDTATRKPKKRKQPVGFMQSIVNVNGNTFDEGEGGLPEPTSVPVLLQMQSQEVIDAAAVAAESAGKIEEPWSTAEDVVLLDGFLTRVLINHPNAVPTPLRLESRAVLQDVTGKDIDASAVVTVLHRDIPGTSTEDLFRTRAVKATAVRLGRSVPGTRRRLLLVIQRVVRGLGAAVAFLLDHGGISQELREICNIALDRNVLQGLSQTRNTPSDTAALNRVIQVFADDNWPNTKGILPRLMDYAPDEIKKIYNDLWRHSWLQYRKRASVHDPGGKPKGYELSDSFFRDLDSPLSDGLHELSDFASSCLSTNSSAWNGDTASTDLDIRQSEMFLAIHLMFLTGTHTTIRVVQKDMTECSISCSTSGE
jgi:hypothetical protein